MYNLLPLMETYLSFCKNQKCLDEKTLKAYRIDLRQFWEQLGIYDVTKINNQKIEEYVGYLHQHYQPKTVKRKIASLKAFFHFLEYRDFIEQNPFNKVHLHFREPIKLPKIIPLTTIELLLHTIYKQQQQPLSKSQRFTVLRDAAVVELLFGSGMRISELCALKLNDVNLFDGTILIYGKGNKERRIQLGNKEVLQTLKNYHAALFEQTQQAKHFFVNCNGHPISDQTVRRMIKHYCSLASIDLHITPHMFRHTFATSLLEADVDIRYIQEMLGHSSINVTEIYTHVTVGKQRDILATKHPRKNFQVK